MRGTSVIVTYRCNIMCSICEYRCAPYKKGYMGVKIFEKEINNVVNQGYNDYVCICGGEPFLNPANLHKYLKIISKLKLRKKVQTNGFWGNFDSFIDIIIGLKHYGLNEIIFEYDYYHSEFIALEVIKNAIEKTILCKLDVSLKAFFTTSNLSSNEDILTYEAIKEIKKEFPQIALIFTSKTKPYNFKTMEETTILFENKYKLASQTGSQSY